ncbi:MAG: glycosyltransferase family 4 protein [Halobacteriota archaeon]|nr:glycosyltransferase family 4 protein [Halobacteriota archaeon]
MKVVFAHQTGPISQREGGALRYTLNAIDLLLKNEVETTLIGVQFNEEETIDRSGFNFIPILKSSYAKYRWHRYFIRLMVKAPFFRLPDSSIIHTCRLDYMLPFLLFCPKNPKVITSDEPLGYARLHYPEPIFNLIALLYHFVESRSFRRIDRLITDTATAKEYYEKRYPWLEDKIRIYTTGIDTGKFKPIERENVRQQFGLASNEKIVLFAGRLEKIKNLDFLLRAFALVEEKVADAKLLIVGEGSERPNLEKLAGTLGLRDKIVFMGVISPEKMPEIYNCADVMALCSVTEGSPTVVREAIACGVPVVSTDVGDVSGTISSEYVGRITEDEEESFADAVVLVLDMAAKEPLKVREECRKIAKEKFGSEKSIVELIEIYQEVNKSQG